MVFQKYVNLFPFRPCSLMKHALNDNAASGFVLSDSTETWLAGARKLMESRSMFCLQ